jgi:flavin-binding protein dodecin
MDDIKVTITDNSKEVLEALQNAIQRAAEAIGEAAVTHAKDNITEQGAVDTGRLRNSITYMVKEE